MYCMYCKGPSINYVISKSAILDLLPSLVFFLTATLHRGLRNIFCQVNYFFSYILFGLFGPSSVFYLLFCSIFVQFQFNLFFHIPLNFYQSDFGFLPNFYYVYFINRPPSFRRTHSLWMTPKGVGTKLIGSLTGSS